MEVRVLGPVEAWVGVGKVQLTRRQQRLILGILALEPNRLVARDRLVHLLWGEHPPQTAHAIIHSRMSEIRSAVAGGGTDTGTQLSSKGSGYILHIEEEEVDAHRFTAYTSGWRSSDTDEQARTRLRGALSLWRGPVLGGWLPDDSYAILCQGLEAARLTAAENLFDVELRLGNHLKVVDEILAASVANPTRERLTGQMMLALHRSGRNVEALHAYDRWRRWLGEELGIDPGPDIQSLHLEILRGKNEAELRHVTLAAAPSETEDSDVESFRVRVPQTLPHDLADFSGRTREVEHLRSRLLRRDGQGVSVTAVTGPGGIGKTALCLHLAHLLSAEFPQGQLYASLRGVDEDGAADPADVLGRFLRALGVDHQAMPDTLEDRVDLYRNLLAGRRVLVLLDNAASDEQLLHLIPGTATCRVLVNSRIRLGATFGAETLHLDVMEQPDAERLLAQVVGVARSALEPQPLAELAQRCGYLPLALRVAGAKLASKPHWTIQKVVTLLHDERNRLDRLTHGNLDVRSSIALSYSGLEPEARKLLRRLGSLGVPEISVWLSAALLDKDLDTAEDTLEVLLDAQLLEVIRPDGDGRSRFRLHDLVRLFARERADEEEQTPALEAAGTRAIGACLFLTEVAYRSLSGGDYLTMHGGAARWTVDDQAAAPVANDPLQWFEVERSTIVTLIRRAAGQGLSEACWDLVCSASVLFPLRGYHDDWQEMLDIGLRAAREANSIRGVGAILYRRGILSADRQELELAEEFFQQAADIFNSAGDRCSVSVVSAYIAMIDRFQGRPEAALGRYRIALAELASYADLGGEAFILRGMGQAYMDLGDHDSAENHLIESLAIFDKMSGASVGRAQALFWLGMLRFKQGLSGQARPLFVEVLQLTRSSNDRYGEAQALRGLGLCLHNDGSASEARQKLLEALRLVSQPRQTLLEAHIRKTLAGIAPQRSGGSPAGRGSAQA